MNGLNYTRLEVLPAFTCGNAMWGGYGNRFQRLAYLLDKSLKIYMAQRNDLL